MARGVPHNGGVGAQRILDLHPWDLSPEEAGEVQRHLRSRLSFEDGVVLEAVHVVAGVDVAYLRAAAETMACAVAVTLRLPSLEVLETRVAWEPVRFPYVPGLLAFREIPALLAALRQVEAVPDVVLVDAHGYAHPRRMGAASHLGLLLDRPTIGCAKSRLVGRYDEPAQAVGAHSPLIDRGEVIGAVVRMRPGCAPLFASVGHKISLSTAVRVAVACATGRSVMPEPTRLADALTKSHVKRRRTQIAEGPAADVQRALPQP